MRNQNHARNSKYAAKRCHVRRWLRSALAASALAGLASSASAQTDLAIPRFPTTDAGLSLPSAELLPNPFAAAASVTGGSSAFEKASGLLGLKKQTRQGNAPSSDVVLTLPTFPTNLPTALPTTSVANGATAPTNVLTAMSNTATNSRAPKIGRSTSSKSELANIEHVVLASGSESSTPTLAAPADELPQQSLVLDASSAAETFSDSLIDIAIPAPSALPPNDGTQRLPQLVKRYPALQLRIGGNANRANANSDSTNSSNSLTDAPVVGLAPNTSAIETSSNKETETATFSLSDANDDTPKRSIRASVHASTLLKAVAPPNLSNPMNVRIEGEPQVAQASAKGKLTPPPQLASLGPVTQPQAVKQLAASPLAATERTATALEISSRSASEKSLTDNWGDTAPTVGDRLEVGLHESANIEITQPISGLSIEHPELCQVLKNGERSVSLVGLKAGQTRVALFTIDSHGERTVQIREVVIAGTENHQADMKSLAGEIGHSIRSMYPKSRIEVIAEADGLTVQGYAGSEEEAKRIISLVRRTSLQPVVDRLATHK